MPTEAAKPKRLQGVFVSDAEIERLVYFWSNQKQDKKGPEIKLDDFDRLAKGVGGIEHREDPLMEIARNLAAEHPNISTSYLQRKLHIGYPRAARIMEALQNEMKESFDNQE
jgi:S-DNA-T family DNA segregation ATPase FtsK/SpoIIIE